MLCKHRNSVTVQVYKDVDAKKFVEVKCILGSEIRKY